MPKTVQIRDLPDDVYAGLVLRAAETGVSVPELLRVEATRLATQPSMAAWLADARKHPLPAIDRREIIAALEESRGPWPNAGR